MFVLCWLLENRYYYVERSKIDIIMWKDPKQILLCGKIQNLQIIDKTEILMEVTIHSNNLDLD